GLGDPRCAGGGAGRGDRLSRAGCPGRVLPAAERARRDVATAADRPRLSRRRRSRLGWAGVDRRVGRGPPVTVLVVTGTDTGVGKTVATAALACHARLAGLDVAVC